MYRTSLEGFFFLNGNMIVHKVVNWVFGQKWETLLVLFVSLEMDDLIKQYTQIRDKIPLVFLCVLYVCMCNSESCFSQLLLHNHFPMLLKFFINVKFYIYILTKKSQEIWALPIWITSISHLPLGFFINENQRQHSEPLTFWRSSQHGLSLYYV